MSLLLSCPKENIKPRGGDDDDDDEESVSDEQEIGESEVHRNGIRELVKFPLPSAVSAPPQMTPAYKSAKRYLYKQNKHHRKLHLQSWF